MRSTTKETSFWSGVQKCFIAWACYDRKTCRINVCEVCSFSLSCMHSWAYNENYNISWEIFQKVIFH